MFLAVIQNHCFGSQLRLLVTLPIPQLPDHNSFKLGQTLTYSAAVVCGSNNPVIVTVQDDSEVSIHMVRNLRAQLDRQFAGHCIGCCGLVEWFITSPDLIPLGFLLVGASEDHGVPGKNTE
jgi:hypothetical protein